MRLLSPLLAVCVLLACAAEPSPAARPGSPLGGLARTDTAPWRGVVEERLAAGGYSYLAVHDGNARRWVAVMGAGAPQGARVIVHALGTRADFHSPRLDRDFDELVFATVEQATPEPGSS